jgi:beta-glucosidase-like glycosyl hydrolase
MLNSRLLNGIPVHSSKFLIINVLKGELRYDSFVVTDWGDIGNIFTRGSDIREAGKEIRACGKASARNGGSGLVI